MLCEQDGAQHTNLRGSNPEHQIGGGGATNLNCLGCDCEEVHYTVAECGLQGKSVKSVRFMGVTVLNAEVSLSNSFLCSLWMQTAEGQDWLVINETVGFVLPGLCMGLQS